LKERVFFTFESTSDKINQNLRTNISSKKPHSTSNVLKEKLMFSFKSTENVVQPDVLYVEALMRNIQQPRKTA